MNNKKLYLEITAGEESYFFTLEEGLRMMSEEFKRINSEGKDFDGCPYEWDFKWMTEEDYAELSQSPDKPTYEPMPEKRKVVCYCGSLRVALDAFKKAEYEAVLKGEIALLPCCMFVDIEREYGAESDYKQKADDLHKRKIDICDEVFVLNVGGYIGSSTKSEIEYAQSIGKPIKYLEPINSRS